MTDCPDPRRSCAYDRDKQELKASLNDLWDVTNEMKKDHAVSMERIEGHMAVGNQRFAVLEKVVFGAIGAVALVLISIAAYALFGGTT